jgi:outer membrane protein insertion porin family
MHFAERSLLRPVAACVALAIASYAPLARAVEPFTVKDIRIEGLQRTDPGTVFAALPFRVGDTYTDDKGAAALRALFATGLFKDVRLEVEGEVIVIIAEERPIISNVGFVGMKEFDKDTLLKSLKDAGIGEGLPFDKAIVDRAEQEIKRQYLSRSLYGAQVSTTVTPLERNRVNLTFTMTEGEPAHIKEIRILGNKAFSEGELKDLFQLTASGWLTWYTKNDRYSRSKLNADLEALRAFYTNHGYLEFDIDSTQVTISPNKQDITITVTVHEGQPYTITGVKLEGEYFGKEDEFKHLVTLRPGQRYRSEDVAATTKAFTDRFGQYGYAFARVDSRTEIDRKNAQVTVILAADPQRRVYVRHVNIAGNTRTRDEVIRREFRQFESAWYDGAKIKLSRDRVDRLGYFKDVNVDTNEVPGSPDQVDLTVSVTEKPTGNLMVGAGYSSAEKLSLSGSIQQDNVFGSGNYLGLQINTSRVNRTVDITTVDPYFTIDGISRAFDVFYRSVRPLNQSGADYSIVTPGASVRFGVPFSEYDTVFFGIGFERTDLQGTQLPSQYSLYVAQFGRVSNTIPLTVGWARDERDSALTPTAGQYKRANLEIGLAGDTRYMRTDLQYQRYFPVPYFNKLSLGVNAEAGYGRGIEGRPYPAFKNFYGGGLGSVRVFQSGSLGQVDTTGAYIGGNKRANVNANLYFPVPGTGNDKSLRVFAFADAGNVWWDKTPFDYQIPGGNPIRASAGIGLSWISPVGPLQLSYGTPLRYKSDDKIERFQFQIGTAF